MKNYKLTILSILLSCCFITSIQLTATASTQPNGKDIAIDDLPTVDRSIAETIADALGFMLYYYRWSSPSSLLL